MNEREIITRERFIERVGSEPVDDDLERCNCEEAGTDGHFLCGWNAEKDLPCFMVGPVKWPKP